MPDADALQSLLDREAIRECVFRYCRGIDRLDEAALRASYWPDATDCHGAYRGSATGFVDAALKSLPKAGRMIHHVGNLSIELRGRHHAAVETYFLAWQRDRRGGVADIHDLQAGRARGHKGQGGGQRAADGARNSQAKGIAREA